MEESQIPGTITAETSSNGRILAENLGEVTSAPTSMESGDSRHKDGKPNWAISPDRTTSLLPPFGAGPLAHLPTPQSPGDLTNYLSGPEGSPLSMEHPRQGHIRYPSFHHPPSHLTSVRSPHTSQRGRATPPFKNSLVFSTSKELKDTSRPEHNSLLEDIEFSRPPTSQVATPSPEVSRTRRASVPGTAPDTEILLATPQPGNRSSSHPYTAPASLAPAPIISPTNSTHSRYHASPEIKANEPQSRQTYEFPYHMAAVVSGKRAQPRMHAPGYYDVDDPFIVRDDEGRREALPRQKYTPPPKKIHRELCATHASTSSLHGKAERRSPLENSIAKLVMSTSEASDAPSHSSPVKTEIDDRHYMGMEPSTSLHINEGRPSHTLMSPRTPLRVGSCRTSMSEPNTSTLENSAFHTPPPLSGGEIERIRQRQALVEQIRISESEKRRPDYLMRIKRARDSADEEAAERERENALPGLGVTISPLRGRRLKLYQPVAVASNVALLEETETDEATEPKTPPPINSMSSWQGSVPSMSLRAIDWHTPRRGRSSPVVWTEEDERKKQKRLQAFAALEPSGKGRRLKPAEVVGQGRVIIDITSEESRKLAEDGILKLFETPETDSVESTELSLKNGHGAEWPDKEYPWSVQERRRDEYEEARRRQRLMWIEHFLDRESESEDEEECVPGPSTWNQTFASSRPPRGHGKTITVNAIPSSKPSKNFRQMTFNAANTDAREVLLSKKHVREVAERLRRRKIAEEEEGVVMCICQGADDGRPMVRCDECRTWYHLICMDIHDESELGDEWYCWKCLPSAEDPIPALPTEPTFAPAMPDSPPRAGVGDQPLYQSPLQPSPMPPSPISRRKSEQSPTRRSRLPHSLGDQSDPVRGGPSTPYHSRVTDSRLYMTPKLYDEYGMDDHTPFDPTSTPSRGLKFPNPVPITPRRTHLSWMTPGRPRTPQFSVQSGSSSTRSVAYSLSTLEESVGPLTSPWPESPTRKSHKGTDSSWPFPISRRVLDSPLTVRSADHRPFLLGIDESPTLHHFDRGKDTELTFRAGHSPHRD